jgi:DNA replication protein DnaC
MEQARVPLPYLSKKLTAFEQTSQVRKNLVSAAERYIKNFTVGQSASRGLMFSGSVGCGKTHLAVAILRGVIERGFTGLYWNVPDLFRAIRSTFGEHPEQTESELLAEMTGVDLLVLDDLGAERANEFVGERLYMIVNRRYEAGMPMIVTTNFTDADLSARLGDRILSRFAEICPGRVMFPTDDFRRVMASRRKGDDSHGM